jgi:hypothetical protein
MRVPVKKKIWSCHDLLLRMEPGRWSCGEPSAHRTRGKPRHDAGRQQTAVHGGSMWLQRKLCGRDASEPGDEEHAGERKKHAARQPRWSHRAHPNQRADGSRSMHSGGCNLKHLMHDCDKEEEEEKKRKKRRKKKKKKNKGQKERKQERTRQANG